MSSYDESDLREMLEEREEAGDDGVDATPSPTSFERERPEDGRGDCCSNCASGRSGVRSQDLPSSSDGLGDSWCCREDFVRDDRPVSMVWR